MEYAVIWALLGTIAMGIGLFCHAVRERALLAEATAKGEALRSHGPR